MKKKTNSILIGAIAIVTILMVTTFGCKKDSKTAHEEKEKENPALTFLTTPPSGEDYQDDVAIWLDQTFDLFANVNSDQAHTNSDLNNTMVADLKIETTPMNHTAGYFGISPLSASNVNDFFGSTIAINSSGGSAYSSFNHLLYSPSKFTPTLSNVQQANGKFEINKSQGFSVQWNADASNSHNVVLLLQDMRDKNIQKTIEVTSTTTTYSFSSTDLDLFSISKPFTLTLARGNLNYLENNGKTLQFRSGVLQRFTPIYLEP